MSLLSIVAAVLTVGQTPTTVVDFSSLLSMEVFPGNGALRVNPVYIAFPDLAGTYSARVKDQNEEYGSFPMNVSQVDLEPFGRLDPANGANGVIAMQKAGDFKFEVLNGTTVVSELSFKIRTIKTGDEFTGKTLYLLDGPWRKWAALLVRTEQQDFKFRVWASTCELDSAKTLKINVQIKKNDAVVAKTNDQVVSSWGWKAFDFGFDQPDGKRAFLWADVMKMSGAYEMVINLDGKRARSFPFTMTGGVPSTNKQSAMDFTPRSQHMLPRVIASASNRLESPPRLKFAYWLESK